CARGDGYYVYYAMDYW
nr:immunoglobulin heavy chain junction region [Mus musculus]MBK4198220.1 immunoglobulin heavy chain junction region [Mus musculus]MBK4198221.1 immunoglobulin heavy chain junction region [Mus musculus]MBK4198222.1 immunoglobulin heavy chain junction region [Mus musculus]MBK4198223.1 immunoglobulin heavy chain junction region [Mus musculus]